MASTPAHPSSRSERDEGVEVRARIERLVSGDSQAAAWLYDEFSSRLYRKIRRRYGHLSGSSPQDLLQDTFLLAFSRDFRVLRALLARHADGELSSFVVETYLWDLACGVAANRRRLAWNRRAVPIDTEEEPLLEGHEEQTVLRDAYERLNACLRGHGERVSLYFSLRYVDGLSPQEIAQATGWTQKVTYKLKEALNGFLRTCRERLGLV